MFFCDEISVMEAARWSGGPREAIQGQPETAYGTITLIDAVA